MTGWFTHDFTLAELKTLRAIERIPAARQRNTLYNGLFEVPTFQEVLDLRARLSRELGREIGVFPETKHPTYFRGLGLDLETPLVRALRAGRLDRAGAKVFVQSFEARNLAACPRVPAAGAAGVPDQRDRQAVRRPETYAEYLTPAGLRELSTSSTASARRRTRSSRGTRTAPWPPRPAWSPDAHAAGLKVIPYTFRAENQFLPAELRVGADPNAYGRAIDEQITFLRTGIDGLFTDQPDIGVLARELAFAPATAS